MGRTMAGLVSGVWVLMLLVAVFGVVLNVPSASGQSGTVYIRADGSIDPPAPISTVDNITYTFTGDIFDSLVVERDDIVIDGAGYTVTGDGSWNGTTLTGRSNVTVGNMTIKNFYAGIWLLYSSNNVLSGNNVANNTYGIGLWSSSNNKIYHNSFNNTYQAPSGGSVNVWDDGYPSGGNYWSDYTDADFHSGPYRNETGSDGIGDSLHVIDANNTDQYPLMGMFSNFNVTSEYNAQTVCNSTISDFQLNGTAIRFNIFGEEGTTGFCRICIPTALMNDSYGVYVNGTEIPYSLLACSNSTHSYLYFNYTHSTQEVIIIPEHPSFLIAPLFMVATLLAVIVYKGKHTSKVNGR